MTEPRDPNQWPAPQGPNSQGHPAQPQEPHTGPTVSYNAAAFEEPSQTGEFDDSTVAPPTAAVPPPTGPSTGGFGQQQSGSFGPPNPQSGSFSQPGTGGFAQPDPGGVSHPQSGAFAGPTSGAYPQQYGDPTSGSHPVPPPTGHGGPGGPGGPGEPPAYGGPGGSGKGGRGRKKPLLLGGGALVVVALLVVGYFVFFTFGGIENSRGAIKNAKGFASKATVTWQGGLPEDGITVGKDAGCYYVLNDSDEITNQLACGPALRAGSDKGEVWDYYHFDVEGNGDNQRAANLTEKPKVGQPAPENGSIVDVDGNEPDDGLDLKDPPLPKADDYGVWMADSFTVDEANIGNEVELGPDPRLISPGVQVTVSSIAEYSLATIEGQPAQAADGQKLFVITLTGDSGPISGSLSTSLDFDLNGNKTSGSSSPSSLGETQILVSVPSSGKSFMVLDSEGHQQTLNLADGTRSEDATTELYYTGTPEPTATLSDVIDFPPTSITQTEAFALSIGFTSARITPYDDEFGWAPAGQQWLIIEMSTSGQTSAGDSSAFQYYEIDCGTSTLSNATTKSCKSSSGSAQTAVWVATVTPGTKSFSGNFIATMQAWGDSQPDAYGGFGPAPVAINFP